LGHQSLFVSGAFAFGVGDGIAGFSLSLLLAVPVSGAGGRASDVSDDTTFLPVMGDSGCNHGCDPEV
jgi:hypothetical protein